MMRQAEVVFCIMIANVSDEASKKLHVLRELTVFCVLPDDIAEKSAEILVAREGEEGAGIGQHANEVGEESDGGEGVNLVLHAAKGVIKPPSGAELDFASIRGFLEGATGGGEDRVVTGVEVVDDGLWKSVFRSERI